MKLHKKNMIMCSVLPVEFKFLQVLSPSPVRHAVISTARNEGILHRSAIFVVIPLVSFPLVSVLSRPIAPSWSLVFLVHH